MHEPTKNLRMLRRSGVMTHLRDDRRAIKILIPAWAIESQEEFDTYCRVMNLNPATDQAKESFSKRL